MSLDLAPTRSPGKPTLCTPTLITAICDYVRKGNYPTAALSLCNISTSSHNHWLQRAQEDMEAGKDICESVYMQYSVAVKAAEAEAEAEMVSTVREAAKAGPQYWAAGMTYLERRHPDRWGRRDESRQGANAPVQIQIINYHGGQAVPLPAVEIHELPPATSE